MSAESKETVASAIDDNHPEDHTLVQKNNSIPSAVFENLGLIQVEKNALVTALGPVSLASLPVRKEYQGDLPLDCDGVTNLGASMILALNFDENLATGGDLTKDLKIPSDVYSALKIMSKKQTMKFYDFRMKLENMEVGGLLGKGKFGSVWNTVFKGCPAALKEIDPRRAKCADIYKEKDMLVYLKNEYVCGILGAWYDGHCYFLMEQCIGSLMDVAKDLSERQQFLLCVDLLQGVDFIHSKGIIHCNIQPENCLVKHGMWLRLGGFGCSQILPKDAVAVNAKQNLGSIGYQEAVTNKNFIYSKSSDIFSAACIIFELTTNGSRLLQYPVPAVGNVDDYITAFEIGRRTGVVQTRDIYDEKFPREPLLQRVNKSCLGNLLTGMITLPWSDRFSAAFAKHHPDITKQIAAYQSEKGTSFVEPPVCVNQDVRFVRTMPDAIGLSWYEKAFASLYYDAEDMDARRRITPVQEQVPFESEGILVLGKCNAKPGAAPGKDLRQDEYDDNPHKQSKRRTLDDEKSMETRTNKIDVGSTVSEIFQRLQASFDATFADYQQCLFAKLDQAFAPIYAKNQTENAKETIKPDFEDVTWDELSTDNNNGDDDSPSSTSLSSHKDYKIVIENCGGVEGDEEDGEDEEEVDVNMQPQRTSLTLWSGFDNDVEFRKRLNIMHEKVTDQSLKPSPLAHNDDDADLPTAGSSYQSSNKHISDDEDGCSSFKTNINNDMHSGKARVCCTKNLSYSESSKKKEIPSRLQIESEKLIIPNKEELKYVPVPEAKVSEIPKRSLHPSAATVKSKIARRKDDEENEEDAERVEKT